MSGKVLQSTIIELAHMYGWRVAHWPSVLITGRGGKPYYATPLAANAKGFPDLVLCRREDRVMFVEVKGDGDRTRPDQDEWFDALTSAGAEVHLFRPSDLDSGRIVDVLTR